MARKDSFQYQLSAAQSLAADFTSPITTIKWLDNIAYQINITTTNSVGTFAVQASADYKTNEPGTQVLNPGHWVNLTLAGGTPNANAANDSILIDLNQLPFVAIRIAYTSNTPGTGTCDIYLAGRQLGG